MLKKLKILEQCVFCEIPPVQCSFVCTGFSRGTLYIGESKEICNPIHTGKCFQLGQVGCEMLLSRNEVILTTWYRWGCCLLGVQGNG